MEYKNSGELCQKMAKRSDGICLLAFSTGKDAVSAWVELKKYFHTIIPVYYYLVPGISFVEASLRYYESFFKTRIIRVPNPHVYRMLNAGVYQTPAQNKIIQKLGFPVVTREDMIQYVREDHSLSDNVYIAIGNRMYDNMQRYRSITKFGAVNDKNKTFYPTYDFRIADVVQSIKSADVKLPVDYHLFGKTFDGLDYRFMAPVKKHYPKDYELIKSYFPFVEAEIMRYEQL